MLQRTLPASSRPACRPKLTSCCRARFDCTKLKHDGFRVIARKNGDRVRLYSRPSKRSRRHDGEVFLYAFDLIELDGADLRREPLDMRKATLASLLRRPRPACASTSTSKPMGQRCASTRDHRQCL